MSALVLAFYVVVGAAIVVAMVWSFFVRRHGESQTPADGWRRTDELFVDPSTNRRSGSGSIPSTAPGTM